MNAAEWLTLIGAISAAIVSVINAVKTSTKLETIHKDTNGNLSQLKAELALARHQAYVRPVEIPQPKTPNTIR